MSRQEKRRASPFASQAADHFNGTRSLTKRAGSATQSKGKTVVSSLEISKLLDPKPDAVIISAQELALLQHTAKPGISRAPPPSRNIEKEMRQERHKALKEKMIAHDREVRLRLEDMTEADRDKELEDQRILTNAKDRLDAEKDDVKHMDAMMKYAKCVTIRDAQILEKRYIQDQLAAEDRRLDQMMEIERIAKIKLQEETARTRAIERKAGASVIIVQIQEREAERVRQQEIREQEAKAMLERIRQDELAAEEKQRQKIEAGKKLLREVLETNEQQAAAKLAKIQEQLKEDQQIAEYIRQKELREQAQEAELKRIAAEKEKEIARLRAQQEKALDRQSSIDELRARRYQEQKERLAREKQLEEARKREATVRDMTEARETQLRSKSERMAQQSLQEREEYYRVLDHQKIQIDKEEAVLREQARKRRIHREQLMEQINEHEQSKVEARMRFMDEGAAMLQVRAAEHQRLENIKADRIRELKASGVPDKYCSEIMKKKVLVANIQAAVRVPATSKKA